MVVATVRPGGGSVPGRCRALAATRRLTARFGVRLIEWFIIGAPGVHCPRDLTGQPERWPTQRRR
jgi:hypothetical protein